MRHLKSGRKLNRTASHRKAMLNNLATSILDKERVTTTVAKAKEVRSLVERLITYGKRGDLHNIRRAARSVKSKDVLKKLFDDIAPTYKDREGGYTRILKLGERRGDNAEMSIIELVGRGQEEPQRPKRAKTAAAKKQKAAAAEKAQKPQEERQPQAVETEQEPEEKQVPEKKAAAEEQKPEASSPEKNEEKKEDGKE
ncbi:MAG: 50S ribosomal protein L17 [Chitinispirillaceae bacterium]